MIISGPWWWSIGSHSVPTIKGLNPAKDFNFAVLYLFKKNENGPGIGHFKKTLRLSKLQMRALLKHNKGFKIIYERPSVTSKKSPNV